MLLKFHVNYGLNKARQFKINFLCFAVYDTVAVTNCPELSTCSESKL
jgi:hypothetical protein